MALLKKLTVVAGVAQAARSYAKKNPEKVSRMAEKAGQFVDHQTKGRYHDKIDGAVRKVRAATRGQQPPR